MDTGGTWGGIPESLQGTLGPGLWRETCTLAVPRCLLGLLGVAPPHSRVPTWPQRDAVRSFPLVDLLASASSCWPWMDFNVSLVFNF